MRPTRIARLLLAAGILPAVAVTAAAGVPTLPSLVTPPAIPAGQPGAVDHSCSTVPAGFSPWTRLYSEQEAGSGAATPSYEIAVDPGHPCRMYRMRTAQTMDRSTDGGRTWQPVLADSANGSSGAFAASTLHITAGGAPLLSEDGNGDAALAGDEGGVHWALTDGGLEGEPVRDLVPAADFQPLHSGAAYALAYPLDCAAPVPPLVGSADCSGAVHPPATRPAIFVTADGGRSWTATTVPPLPDVRSGTALLDCSSECPRPMQLRLDPSDPAHFWLLVHPPAADRVPGAVGAPAAVLFESHNSGTSYSLVTTFSSDVTQLLVASGPGSAARLYVVTPLTTPQVSYTDDDGAVFTPVAVPSVASPHLGMSRADSGRLAFVGVQSTVTAGMSADIAVAYTTTDAFAHVTGAVLRGLVAPTMNLHTPLDSSALGSSNDADRVVQADTSGSFYLSIDERCGGGACGGAMTRQSLWRLHPDAVQQALPPGRCPVTCGSSSTTPPTVQQELLSCAIPHRSGDGPLAFDGKALLYTTGPETGPGPDQAVIDELDPATCADAGRIVVDFDPQELESLQQMSQCADQPPLIDEMTYDQRRNLIWATLSSGTSGGSCPGALFQVTVTDRSPVGHAGARLAPYGLACGQYLAYDYTDDSFWTCAHLAAADGHGIPSCVPDPTIYGSGAPNGIATWVAAPPELYLWLEDDSRIVAYNPAICRTDRVIAHRPFSEPLRENEQMACDPLTFGPGSSRLGGVAGGALPPTTVLWIRDATADLVSSFAISAGACPLPTAVHLSGPTDVGVGQAAQLCTGLDQRYPGGTTPRAADLALSYSGRGDDGTALAGPIPLTAHTSVVGASTCVSWPQSLQPGSYTVTARFAGTEQFLPSAATWTIRVLPPVQPHRPPSSAPALLLPPPAPGAGPQLPSQPQPPPQVQPAAQAQIQAQSQTQVQSQANAQVQPGMMQQRQRQVRVAVAMEAAMTPQRQAAAMLATRSRNGAAIGEGLMAALLLVGIRLAQPAWCDVRRYRVARSRRRR